MHACTRAQRLTHSHDAVALAPTIAQVQVGQLGGGVSVCLRSLADLDWGKGWAHFAEVVGRALWGRFSPCFFPLFGKKSTPALIAANGMK